MKNLTITAYAFLFAMFFSLKDSCGSAAEVMPTINPSAQENSSDIVAKISQTIEKGEFEAAEIQLLQLRRKGTNALPDIKAGLGTENPKVRMSLASALSGISNDAATEAILGLAVNDVDDDVASVAAGMLEKRPLHRSLTSNELSQAVTRMRNSSPTKSGRWAGLLARIKDAKPSDAGVRMAAILERYEFDAVSSATNFTSDGYLSPNAMRLNVFLIAMPHIAAEYSIPIVKKRHSEMTNKSVRKWLLFARGMCRDTSAEDELHKFVFNSEEDISERALALRAYVMSVGTNAIPVLESLIENNEIGYVPGHPPSEPGSTVSTRPIHIIAKDELAGLKYPELRLKFRGY